MLNVLEKTLAHMSTSINNIDKASKENHDTNDKITADLDFIAMEMGIDLDQDSEE